jgi:hypothetical protein
MCDQRNIPGFQIEKSGGGNSGFYRYLSGLPARTGAHKLKGVLLVSDNDESPDDSFKFIRDQIKKAKLPAPDNPMDIAKWTTIDVAVAVMMIPYVGGLRQKGCLETMLLTAVQQQHAGISACVEAYADCTGANAWANSGKIDKMRLRCILSAAWADDPNLGLQYALEPQKNLIPLRHSCFDEIEDFVRKFPAAALAALGNR